MLFEDRIVVVTGASSGIGKATAELFLKEGAHVIMVSRNPEHLAAAKAELCKISHKCESYACDVSKQAEVQKLFAYVEKRFGKLDVLHNNAGVSIGGGLLDTTEQEWDATLSVNLKGAFFCSKYAVPLLKKGTNKAIVNTVSELGIVATRNALAYISSKGALMQFTKGAALELAPFGIRVNAVCPAGTESEMFRQDMSACEGGYEQNVRRLAASYPLGRIAVPMDIAPAVLFLASEHASFMTGAHILLDAGFTIQ